MELKLNHKDEKKVDEIIELIKKNKKFIITTHQNPDGDAISSELAIYTLLKRMGKEAEIINESEVPKIYKFLPDVKKVKVYKSNRKKFDVGIILDCGSIERIGKVRKCFEKTSKIINIDHHLTNAKFGDVNWVNSSFSSCGEMVYFIFEKLSRITKKEATYLYTAILTDTCGFIHHLTPYTMEIAKRLIEKGAEPEKIARKVYLEKPLKSVRLFILSLNSLKFDRKNKVCWSKVTEEMYRKTGTDEEDTEGFVDFLTTIKEAEVVFLIKEKNNGIKVSFRSKGKFDVEELARKFGGGGHKEASGCFFENESIEEVEKKVIQEISKRWKEY